MSWYLADVLRGGFDVDIPLFGRRRDDLPYHVEEYQVRSAHLLEVFLLLSVIDSFCSSTLIFAEISSLPSSSSSSASSSASSFSEPLGESAIEYESLID